MRGEEGGEREGRESEVRGGEGRGGKKSEKRGGKGRGEENER